MEKNEINPIKKVIEEIKSIEKSHKKNMDEIDKQTELLKKKKAVMTNLKKENDDLLKKILILKKQIQNDNNARELYISIQNEYDKALNFKNEFLQREKNFKNEISQKKLKIKKIENETEQVEKNISLFSERKENSHQINYDEQISRREKLNKDHDEIKISIAYLKKSNKDLQGENEEMEYILKSLENSL